jgi:hypothetical protein
LRLFERAENGKSNYLSVNLKKSENMNLKKHELEPSKGQFLIYKAEDGSLKLDVRLERETVWLTQKLMAELFQKDVRTINHHIQGIYEEGELDPTSTIRKYRIVQSEGGRTVTRIVA